MFRKQNYCLREDLRKIFFFKFGKPSYSEIKNAADGLQKACSEESYLYERLVQFSCLLNEKCSGINVAEIFECTGL